MSDEIFHDHYKLTPAYHNSSKWCSILGKSRSWQDMNKTIFGMDKIIWVSYTSLSTSLIAL